MRRLIAIFAMTAATAASAGFAGLTSSSEVDPAPKRAALTSSDRELQESLSRQDRSLAERPRFRSFTVEDEKVMINSVEYKSKRRAAAEARRLAAEEAARIAAERAAAAEAARLASERAAERQAAERRAAKQAAAEAARKQAAAEAARREAAAAAKRAKQAPRASRSRTAPPVTSGGADGVWAALRKCESGGNYAINTGNGYYGAYQFSASTWNSMGTGYARADLAPPAVQDDAARRLQARAGWGQWPACSRKLGLR